MDKDIELTEQQREQWSAVAPGWQKWTDWFEEQSAALTRRLCDDAGVAPGKRILDLACGGGEPAATAAARVAPSGSILATDLSPEMVEATRHRAGRLGLGNLEARVMDAQALDLPDHSFDGATCRFGLMFCPDPVRAASEVRRVLRPGAHLAAAVWDTPATNPFFMFLMGILAKFTTLPAPDPTAPGLFRLAPPGEFERTLVAAGFKDVHVESFPMLWSYPSAEAYWQIQTDIAAPLRALIAKMDAGTVAALKAAVIEGLELYTQNGRVQLAAVALCARATA
ncbi:MAG: methyltransferase domain-containing protein [Thermoanaerobaculia bacterium]